MARGDKAELDRRVSFALYDKSETEVSHITSEFIRQLSQMLAERGQVTVECLGRFRVLPRRINQGHYELTHKKSGNEDIATHRHVLVYFSKARPLKELLDRVFKGEMMEKYGVDETTGHSSEQLEKMAAEGCPECGSKLTKHGSVMICPVHGSAPFEASPNQGGEHGSKEEDHT